MFILIYFQSEIERLSGEISNYLNVTNFWVSINYFRGGIYTSEKVISGQLGYQVIGLYPLLCHQSSIDSIGLLFALLSFSLSPNLLQKVSQPNFESARRAGKGKKVPLFA